MTLMEYFDEAIIKKYISEDLFWVSLCRSLFRMAFFVFVVFLTACFAAFPVKWLWNWVMPIIFDLPTITAAQGWGLTFLGSFLTKGGGDYTKAEVK
jgi:hypothetical protein